MGEHHNRSPLRLGLGLNSSTGEHFVCQQVRVNRTKLGSALLMGGKANLPTPGYGERKYSVYLQVTKQGEGAAHAQKT